MHSRSVLPRRDGLWHFPYRQRYTQRCCFVYLSVYAQQPSTAVDQLLSLDMQPATIISLVD
jgi:hypothetical protein